MTASENIVRHCPKCGSVRVHRSRRRGPVEQLIACMGGEICRCHDCCGRQAWFGPSPWPIGNTDPEVSPWAGIALFVSGCAGCLGLVWWIVVRYTHMIG
jgi:hypothetical protein